MKGFGVLLLMFSLLLICGCQNQPELPLLPPQARLLAFGDSLTFGRGAGQGESYPAQLAAMTGREVINAGVSGEISAAGARRLPALLDRHRPDLLLLCHGGNDLLRHAGLSQLKENLRQMILAARQRGIPLLLIAVPQPNLLLQDAPVYRELAEEYDLPLLAEQLGDLLGERRYKSDTVHLNAAGYGELANGLRELLEKSGAL